MLGQPDGVARTLVETRFARWRGGIRMAFLVVGTAVVISIVVSVGALDGVVGRGEGGGDQCPSQYSAVCAAGGGVVRVGDEIGTGTPVYLMPLADGGVPVLVSRHGGANAIGRGERLLTLDTVQKGNGEIAGLQLRRIEQGIATVVIPDLGRDFVVSDDAAVVAYRHGASVRVGRMVDGDGQQDIYVGDGEYSLLAAGNDQSVAINVSKNGGSHEVEWAMPGGSFTILGVLPTDAKVLNARWLDARQLWLATAIRDRTVIFRFDVSGNSTSYDLAVVASRKVVVSPDGSSIAVDTWPDATGGIQTVVFGRDGDHRRVIPGEELIGWSPNGEAFATLSAVQEVCTSSNGRSWTVGRPTVHVYRQDGQPPRELVGPGCEPLGQLNWTTDGAGFVASSGLH